MSMDSSPATKADLKNLDNKFSAITRNIAIQMTTAQADIREIKSVMSTKADIDRVMRAIAVFAARTEDQGRAMVLHGQALTETAVALKDHDRRIAALESRPV